METVPKSREARLPCGAYSSTKCKPRSLLKPRSLAAFGWLTCAIIPSSDKKSLTLSSASLACLVSLFIATISPSGKTPLYTSACPPFPIIFSNNITQDPCLCQNQGGSFCLLQFMYLLMDRGHGYINIIQNPKTKQDRKKLN